MDKPMTAEALEALLTRYEQLVGKVYRGTLEIPSQAEKYEADLRLALDARTALRTGHLVYVDDGAVERVAASLPRLDDGLIEAALIGHYGKRHLGIDGTGMTVRGYDYSFRRGFKRMWSGVRKELKRRASIAAMGGKP